MFLARDQLLDRPVAVKVLFPQFAAEPTFVERFRREAQAAANLNHPSIVAVYDWGEHDNTYFIVMEYVEGRSLAEIIRAEGTLHPDRSAEISTDVAAALGFAHRNGTVHRDVKPGNILITPAGQVKVTDFGIARAFGGGDDLTQTGSVMGTATYFSPEQAQGKNVDPRSDLYSLGVVLFEMLTGTPPFLGDSPVAIAYKHVQEAPPRPTSINPAIPKSLEGIISRLLAKNPDQRYASAEDVRADLRRFRKGEPLTGVPSTGSTVPTEAPQVAAQVQQQRQEDSGRAVIDSTRAMPATVAAQQEIPVEEYYEPPRRNGAFLALLALLLVALAGIILYAISALGGGPTEVEPGAEVVETPGVLGSSQADAERVLIAAGLQPNTVFEENADTEPGLVFAQDPGEGTELAEGSPVTIKVSKTLETVPLPNVTGLTEADAQQQLNALGLRVDRIREASDEYDEGIVIGMTPQPNQEVNDDALITLTISTGPAQIEVPDLSGKTNGEASNLLGLAGLPNPSIILEPSSDVEKGLVIRTDPVAGTPVSKDRVVLLYVSDGPETDLVPIVVGLTQQAAEQAIQSKGFEVVVVFVEVVADAPQVGKVISQDQLPNNNLEVGSTVTINVGRAADPPSTTEATTTTTEATTTTTEAAADGG